MMARYASYETLSAIIRHRFTNPRPTLKEMFSRLVFNILCVTRMIMRGTMQPFGMVKY